MGTALPIRGTDYFGNLSQTATGDFDHDGVSNLQEFLDGTNPADKNSVRFRLSISSFGGYVTASPTRLSYTNGEAVTLTATPTPPNSFRAWAGDVISTTNPIVITMTSNKTVLALAGPFPITWTNSASGAWEVASQLEPQPGAQPG